VSADCLSNYDCVVDLVYRATETHLAAAARARMVPVVEGLEILVGQGALSFEQFTGASAPVEVMRAAARAR
jgi:shikimate 5-dehydrogenase